MSELTQATNSIANFDMLYCSQCALPLKQSESGVIGARTPLPCPRCQYTEVCEITPSIAVEIEPIFYLYVEFGSNISMPQIRCLRQVSLDLAAQPIAQLCKFLRSTTSVTIGPLYTKSQMQKAKAQLEILGMQVNIEWGD